MIVLARPDLPAHHPQNVPLGEWSDGWLKLSVASHIGASYIIAHDHEKRDAGQPVTASEMRGYLIERGDMPAAGP